MIARWRDKLERLTCPHEDLDIRVKGGDPVEEDTLELQVSVRCTHCGRSWQGLSTIELPSKPPISPELNRVAKVSIFGAYFIRELERWTDAVFPRDEAEGDPAMMEPRALVSSVRRWYENHLLASIPDESIPSKDFSTLVGIAAMVFEDE